MSGMPPDDQLPIKFVVHLSRATRTIRMYSPDHPAVQRGAAEAFTVVEEALARERQITFGRREGVLIYQDRPIREQADATGRFLDMLDDLDIETITMSQGLTEDELAQFVKAVGTKQDDKAAARAQIDGLPHISTNAVTYRAVSVAQDKIIGRFDDQTLNKLASMGTDEVNVAMFRAANQLADDLNAAAAADGGSDQGRAHRIVRQFSESTTKLVEETGIEVNQLGASLLDLIESLDPAVQQSLFGQQITDAGALDHEAVRSRLELTFKAGVMANELRRGVTDDDEWAARLERLLNSSQDVVGLAESIAEQVATDEGSVDEESLSKLLRLLQTQAKPEAFGGDETVLIADPDPAMVARYKQILERSGVQLITAGTGPTALRMARDLQPDCLVLDIHLPEMSGLEVIQQLDQEKNPVPIIVYTDTDNFRGSFEIEMREQLKYLVKPFDANAFMDAIEGFVIRGRGQRAHAEQKVDPAQEKEDLAKARRVQAGLLPSEIPDLHGFEIGAYYNACRDVGGDYFDFFSLDADHHGFLIADVAGKGISAAMVMCMARTVFHSLNKETLSPRELMLRANEIIHRDLVHGMFLTAMYIVLNHRTGDVQFCCAGHNPALIYNYEHGMGSFTKPSGIALGLIGNEVFEEALEEHTLSLREGDQLVMYTDGVVESTNPAKEEFGEARLTQIVNQNQDYSTQEILELIVAAIRTHQGSNPQFDDITLVGLRNVGEDYYEE